MKQLDKILDNFAEMTREIRADAEYDNWYARHNMAEDIDKAFEEAKQAIQALIEEEKTKARIEELTRRRSRFEVLEEIFTINGKRRPAAEGRNALKLKELLYIDERIAALNQEIKRRIEECTA